MRNAAVCVVARYVRVMKQVTHAAQPASEGGFPRLAPRGSAARMQAQASELGGQRARVFDGVSIYVNGLTNPSHLVRGRLAGWVGAGVWPWMGAVLALGYQVWRQMLTSHSPSARLRAPAGAEAADGAAWRAL